MDSNSHFMINVNNSQGEILRSVSEQVVQI